MFLGNPDLLERNLRTDLNNLLKNIKVLEDQHIHILEYNRNLLNKLSEIESSSFLIEEANKHRAFLLELEESSASFEETQKIILEKYVCTSSMEVSISRLMGRVLGRIIEICGSCVEKTKHLDVSVVEEFKILKDSLLENIEEGRKINIQIVFELPINYIQTKFNREAKRLTTIIEIISKGNFDALREVSIEARPSLNKNSPSSPKIETTENNNEKVPTLKDKRAEEKERMKSIDISKRKKAKTAKELITNMYSTMDLAKQNFIEDFGYNPNPEEKRRKLYEEMLFRNKFNQEQIREFESKQSDYESKVKEFKERMEMESKKIQKAIAMNENKEKETSIEIDVKLSTEEDTLHESTHKTVNEETETESKKSTIPQKAPKTTFRREVKHMKGRSPRFTKQISFSAMRTPQEGFEHIRFDDKNGEIFTRSNRAHLPQLGCKSSLDGRLEYKNSLSGREKNEKQEKKVSIMKNVEIGAQSFNMTNSYCFQNKNMKRSPRDRVSPNEALFEIGNGVGFEYTFYAQKKGNGYFTKNLFF